MLAAGLVLCTAAFLAPFGDRFNAGVATGFYNTPDWSGTSRIDFTMHINDWANWQYMHWFVIGMLMVVWICVMCLTRTIRLGKKIPLYGIDWIGLLLWTAMLFAIVFICIYGDFTTGWTACRFAPAL